LKIIIIIIINEFMKLNEMEERKKENLLVKGVLRDHF